MFQVQESAASAQFLTFTIAGEEYGVPIAEAREIMQFRRVTRIPTTPPWVRGAINLRGSVVPVIDLQVRFGLGRSEVTRRSCIIIIDFRAGEEAVPIGIMADLVNQVIELDASEIAACPEFGTRAQVEFLRGMARRDDSFVLLLDVDRLVEAGDVSAVLDAAPEVAPVVEALETPAGPQEADARDA